MESNFQRMRGLNPIRESLFKQGHFCSKNCRGPSIWKSTVGKLRGGLSAMERKMQSIVKKDEDESEAGTEPVGHFRNDQIVNINREPETLQFSQPLSQDRRSDKSDQSRRSRGRRPRDDSRKRTGLTLIFTVLWEFCESFMKIT